MNNEKLKHFRERVYLFVPYWRSKPNISIWDQGWLFTDKLNFIGEYNIHQMEIFIAKIKSCHIKNY